MPLGGKLRGGETSIVMPTKESHRSLVNNGGEKTADHLFQSETDTLQAESRTRPPRIGENSGKGAAMKRCSPRVGWEEF